MADSEILYIIRADNKQAVQALKELGVAQEKVTKTTEGLQRSSSQANMMLMSTGRIVQDAPFGLMGMGNNITFLAEQFGNARAQGQSFKEVIKGMGSAMLGTGGVIFAISTLVSIMTVMNRNTESAESYTKSFIDEVIKGGTASEEFAKALGLVNKELKTLSDETISARIKSLSDDLNSLMSSFMFQFNKEGFGKKAFALQQLLGEQESRNLKNSLGIGGQELGLIQRLQEQIKINTELRDGAQTLGEQANYQKIINQLQEQLNTQLGVTKRELKEVFDFYSYITKIMDNGKLEESGMLGDVKYDKYGLGSGDATRRMGAGGAGVAMFSRGYIAQMQLVQTLTMSSADVLRNEFGSAWQDIFGEANSLFEKFMMNIAEQLANLAISNIAGSFLNFLFPGAGFVGDLFNKPQVINVNVGNETVERVVVSNVKSAQQKRLL